jgi:hypothetical protein
MSKGEGASADGEDSLPAIDFATFVLSLSHSALMHLGDAPDPSGGTPERDVTMAKQTIDLLAVLQEKTAGNLSGEEERLLDQVMYDLRLRYEEVVREA